MNDRHTYDMGVIGNCAYLAYVDKEADIKWMCWPRFDSSYIFGGLLDTEKGGYFYIKPQKKFKSRQYYLKNTNILCTEFTTSEGKFRVIDFAPRFPQYDRHFKPLMLVRIVEPLDGHPLIRMGCQPIGSYGNIAPVSYMGSNHIRYLGLERPLRLTTDFPLNFLLDERPITLDKTMFAIMTYGIPLEGPLRTTSEDFLQKTQEYWENWINNASIPHHYQEEVIRSSLILKLHQYQDTGAIIAAGSTSLPESPHEGRNWDYRFCWMRDSFYTLKAINNIGHFNELKRFSSFIQNVATVNEGRYTPLYSITGNIEDTEERILNLKGYLGNQPVRIGNQAVEHIQNDIYGQILLSLLPLYTDERFVQKDEKLAIRNTTILLSKIEETIDEPDAGLWEFRNKQQHHCYTFLFHWAGSNAAKKIGLYFKNTQLVSRADKLIIRAAKNIEKCYDKKEQVYRQAIETNQLDASLFQLITLGYLDPNSSRAKLHLKKLEEELRFGKSLFYRYIHNDDFGKPKTTFLVCAFWYVEALAFVGRVDEAIETLNDLIQYGNHLGLFSEDIDGETGSQWGNFPQTYSHVGLVNAVYAIDNKLNMPDFLVY